MCEHTREPIQNAALFLYAIGVLINANAILRHLISREKSKQKEKSLRGTLWTHRLVSSVSSIIIIIIIGKETHRHCHLIRDWNISDINAPPNRKVFYVPNVIITMLRTTLWERHFPTSSTTTTSTKNQCSSIVVHYPMHRIIGVTSWSRSRSE